MSLDSYYAGLPKAFESHPEDYNFDDPKVSYMIKSRTKSYITTTASTVREERSSVACRVLRVCAWRVVCCVVCKRVMCVTACGLLQPPAASALA